jgi:hypothetical protein
MCIQVLTWSTCQLTHHDVDVGNHEKIFLNAITGIVVMLLKELSDPQGEEHAMLPTTTLRVLQIQILKLGEAHAAKKGNDIAWMDLMTYRIKIICKGTRHTCGQEA